MAALRGGIVDAVATALTFVPASALAEFAPRASGTAAALAFTAERLAVDLAFVPSWAPWAPAAVRLLAEEGIAAAWVVRGPLWPALEQHGLDIGLRMTVRDPEALAPALDAQVQRSRAAVLVGVRLGVAVTVIAEDLAGSSGMLVAPDFAIDEIVPRLDAIAAPATDDGRCVLLHSDGDIRLMLPSLARLGFDGVHGGGGLTEEAFERLFWAARHCGLGIMGGVRSGDLATITGAVFAGTTRSVLAHSGGLVVADDGGIETGDQLGKLVTALAAARRVDEVQA